MSNRVIVNLDSLMDRLERLADPQAAVDRGITKCCLAVEATAKQNCPVDTGRLRGSITHDVNNGEGKVGTNVEYANFVEFGTIKQRPQPFLYPALEANKSRFTEIMADEIETELNRR